MTSEPRSPRLARLLLGLLLPERYRDNQLGDLEEEFRARGHRDGWRPARRWYWLQAVASLPGAGRLRFRDMRSHDRSRRGGGMERAWQDLRYAVRSLLANPQYAIIAILTLAMGIGVNTSIFSLVNQVIFIDLPMEDPDELYWVWSANTEAVSGISPMSLADFQDVRERTRSFDVMAALQQGPMILTGVEEPERITVARATANIFEVWGDQPVLGRGFIEGEDLAGAAKVAVITHGYWTTRYGADPGVLGRTIRLDGDEHRIVGVGSPQLETGNLGRARVWVPLVMGAARVDRDFRTSMITGRLAEKVTFEQARAEAAQVGEALAAENPITNRGWEIQVRTTDDSLLGDAMAAVMTLLVLTVSFVLLIACANVANLVLVRASSRMKEIAVRSALGASRSRLLRQLLTENLLIALAAGVVGVGLAHLLLRSLVLITRGREVLFNIATIDQRVLVFTLLVALATPLLFGLPPAVGTLRMNLTDAFRDGVRGGGSRGGMRTRGLLVVSQVALALSLMLVSGVLARSVIESRRLDLGFDDEGVLSMVLQLPATRYDGDAASLFFEALEERVAAIPGVRDVALAGGRPQMSLAGGSPFAVEGRDVVADEDLPTGYVEVVSSHYFDVLGIPLIRGRAFVGGDRVSAEPVAVVSQETVDRYWAGEDPIGRRIRVGVDRDAPWHEVVGVVANVLGGSSLSTPDVPQIYLPFRQAPRTAMVLLARTQGGDETRLAGPIRQEVWQLDPEQPVDDVRTMSDYVYDMGAFENAIIALFVAFALFALGMAAMGIYGVMSFLVSRRSREIGVRIAIGAERVSVLRMVLAQGGKLLAGGAAIGFVIGYGLSVVTASQLQDIVVNDALTLIGVPVVLLTVALVANLVPALRATRVDVVQTLRTE